MPIINWARSKLLLSRVAAKASVSASLATCARARGAVPNNRAPARTLDRSRLFILYPPGAAPLGLGFGFPLDLAACAINEKCNFPQER
ncbi:hypothetical protein D3C87_1890150 [compost metagenome]